MKAVYILTVEYIAEAPPLAIAQERTFFFSNLAERQHLLDWVREMGWKHSTDIDFVTTSARAKQEILDDISTSKQLF